MLSGNLTIGPADIQLTDELTAEELETVTLTPQDLQVLEARFGYRISEDDTTTFDFYDALSMNLELEMGRDVWLRSTKNPDMNVEFDGRIRAEKRPFEDPLLFGTINVNTTRSYVKQYGRKFTMESGSLRFNGLFDETLVDLHSVYQVPSRKGNPGPRILLDITGRLDDLDVEPSSEPDMETIDILSYIATGRPADEGLFGGGSGIEQQAAGLAIGQLGTLVEGIASDELGLDVIEIESDGLRGATFTIGKYVPVGDKLFFASLRQPLNLSSGDETARLTRNTEAAVEFRLLKSMLLRIASRNRSPRFNLLYEYAY
jgi:translocation and assembly module TamB